MIAENLRVVRDRISGAAAGNDWESADVKLIAVSKTFGRAHIEAAIHAGQQLFGENRVQESQAKWPSIKQAYPEVEVHLIGPLQSNKVKDAVKLFDCIQTLDREKLARIIAEVCDDQGSRPSLFVQVNTGEEDQKAGVPPVEVDRFIQLCRATYGLDITGLMCIPPLNEEPSLHFTLLATIAERNGISELSMGMSADYECAIACGATMVRVGSAIFGPRD